MKIDLFSDLSRHCRQKLQERGYSIDKIADDGKLMIAYIGAARRVIEQHPRKVRVSAGFICPTELQSGFDILIEKIKTGSSVRGHQSKRLDRPSFEDTLLNAWGIEHFHLGDSETTDGWVSRTGPLLFAIVTQNDFYCLDILPHGSWHHQSLVQPVHDNWSELLKNVIVENAIDLAHVPSDDDVKVLHASNINTMIKMTDGTIYGPPGGGFSTDGSALNSVLAVNRWVKWAYDIEGHIRDRLNDDFGNKIRNTLSDPSFPIEEMKFEMRLSPQKMEIVELVSTVSLEFEPVNLPSV